MAFIAPSVSAARNPPRIAQLPALRKESIPYPTAGLVHTLRIDGFEIGSVRIMVRSIGHAADRSFPVADASSIAYISTCTPIMLVAKNFWILSAYGCTIMSHRLS
jgi:hypothetical protein